MKHCLDLVKKGDPVKESLKLILTSLYELYLTQSNMDFTISKHLVMLESIISGYQAMDGSKSFHILL